MRMRSLGPWWVLVVVVGIVIGGLVEGGSVGGEEKDEEIVCLGKSCDVQQQPVVVDEKESVGESCGCGAKTSRTVFEENSASPSPQDGEGDDGVDELSNEATATATATAKQVISPPGGMKYIPGGELIMGASDAFKSIAYAQDGEYPQVKVKIEPFFIDETEVTNKQFSDFVMSTKYITDAQKYNWSFVFQDFIIDTSIPRRRVINAEWWVQEYGAFWYTPEGPGSTLHEPLIDGLSDVRKTKSKSEGHRWDHPVIHVSWNDAKAFCKWAGKRLVTEAEFEWAARGGKNYELFFWGNDTSTTDADGNYYANLWQSSIEYDEVKKFPRNGSAEDGWIGTAPVKSFPPNGYGVYDMTGNVWEWVYDWFVVDRSTFAIDNSTTPPYVDWKGPKTGTSKVQRGGSYMCHPTYCYRYRISARVATAPDSSTGNLGFRCAKSVVKRVGK